MIFEEEVEFNNFYILQKMDENKNKKNKKIIDELKIIEPLLNDEILFQLYNKSLPGIKYNY